MEVYNGIILQNHLYEKDARDPLDPLGTPLDPPRTPLGPHGAPPRTPMEHKNKNISTNSQREKVSIAASESFRCNASLQ